MREAMTRLFADNRVRVVTEGPPSHPRNKIVEASNDPSNALPTLPTGVCVSPPLYPPLALEGGRALEDAPLPTPPREGKYRVVGTTPAGTVCIACHQAAGDVLKIKPDEPGAKAETLHEGCAPRWFK